MYKRLIFVGLLFFVALGLFVVNFSTSPSVAQGGNSFYYQLWEEPEAGEQPLVNAIQRAHDEIDVVMYLFTDKNIAVALKQAAARGVRVHVLLEKSPYKAQNVNAWLVDYWHDSKISWHFVPSLSSGLNFYHQKSMVIDHAQLWVMTMNFVKSSFYKSKPERNFILEDRDPLDVKGALAIFAQDWQNQIVRSIDTSHLVVSPLNTRMALLALVKNSHDRLEIYAEGLSDVPLLRAIEQAAARGVKVHILYGDNLRPRVVYYLKRYHVQFKRTESFHNHAKVMIADGLKIYLGSANFTKNSLEDNRELGIVLNDKKLAKMLESDFSRDWQQAS